MKAVIIGGGVSGTLCALNLLRDRDSDIVLIERSSTMLNRGPAYASSLPHQLLNVPAGGMSVDVDRPDHFHQWLRRRGHRYSSTAFVPRSLFGEYVSEQFAAVKETSVRLRVVIDEVERLEFSGHDYEVLTRDGHRFRSEVVLICTGNQLPINVNNLTDSAAICEKYIREPWSGDNLRTVRPDHGIIMVGAGLTMVDQVLSLRRMGHKGPIQVISRRGILPLAHGHSEPMEINVKGDINEVFRSLRKEAEKAESEGKGWISVIDALRPQVQAIWSHLDETDRARFLRHLRPFWEIHRHRVPKESLSHIEKMRSEGKLDIVAGRIVECDHSKGQFQLTYTERFTGARKRLSGHWLINCTGPQTYTSSTSSPFFRSLISKGLATLDSHGLGIRTASSGAVINARGTEQRGLFAIGPVAKASLWECTALREILTMANKLPAAISAIV